MKKVYDVLKGLAIGISNAIAGLSGGTVAVICGVYDRFVSLFADFFSHPKRVIKENWIFIISILLGFAIGAMSLSAIYAEYPLQISCLFSGLVMCSIIPILKKIDFNKDRIIGKILIIVAFTLVIIMPLLSAGGTKTLQLSFLTFLIVLFLGMIVSGTMIIPGISGSMILLLFGYYSSIYSMIYKVIVALFSGEWSIVLDNALLLFAFVIGAVIGLVTVSKLIKLLFKKAQNLTYCVISGLVAGSPISILIMGFKSKDYTIPSTDRTLAFVASGFLLVLGFVLGFFLERLVNKVAKKKEINYLKSAKDKLAEATKMLENLISFESVLEEFAPNSDAPFGVENKKALHYLLNKAKADGFITYNDENYAGHIEFGKYDGELVGVLAHLDVVPVSGQEWDTNPFELVIKNGKMYGRGTEDDKGPLVAAYYALKIIKESNLPVSKRVRLICGCDEESGSRCLSHYFKTQDVPNTGFSPDAEFPLIYGEKANVSFNIIGKLHDEEIIEEFLCGDRYNIVPAKAKMKLKIDYSKEYLEFLKTHGINDELYKGAVEDGYLVAYGVASHAMVPQNGLNAASILFEFLDNVHPTPLSNYYMTYLAHDPYGKKIGIDIYDNDMKELTMNVAVVNIINQELKIGINCRIPVDGYEKEIEKKMNSSFTNNNFMYQLLFAGDCHYINPNSDLVKTLMKAYQEISGDYTNKPFTIGGGTYARFIKQAVAFGPMFPGNEDVCHIANEYIKVEDFVKSIAIYTKAIYDLIK